MNKSAYQEQIDLRCPFQELLDEEAAATKRWNKRVLVEPLIILALIFGYCALQATMQQRDLQAQLVDQEKARAAICQIHQYNTLHQFDCTIINKNLAKINHE